MNLVATLLLTACLGLRSRGQEVETRQRTDQAAPAETRESAADQSRRKLYCANPKVNLQTHDFLCFSCNILQAVVGTLVEADCSRKKCVKRGKRAVWLETPVV